MCPCIWSGVKEREKILVTQTVFNTFATRAHSTKQRRFTNTICNSSLKGGYLDFSHLTELKNIDITEIYMKKKNKSSITKKHQLKKSYIFYGVPLKGYVAS